jgi:hypothetical protein
MSTRAAAAARRPRELPYWIIAQAASGPGACEPWHVALVRSFRRSAPMCHASHPACVELGSRSRLAASLAGLGISTTFPLKGGEAINHLVRPPRTFVRATSFSATKAKFPAQRLTPTPVIFHAAIPPLAAQRWCRHQPRGLSSGCPYRCVYRKLKLGRSGDEVRPG